MNRINSSRTKGSLKSLLKNLTLHRITLEITRLGKKKEIKILEQVFRFKGFTRFLAELY